MDLTGKNKNIAIAGGIVISSLLVAGAIFTINGDFSFKKESDNSNSLKDSGVESVVLQRDGGVNVDIDYNNNNTKSVFFRYRFFDTETNETVNISEDNAKVFLTTPTGERSEVASELFFYPLRIVPPSQEGEYKLEAILNDDKTHIRSFDVPKVESIKVYLTKEVKEVQGENTRAVLAEDVDISKAEEAYHILPNGAAYLLSEIEGRVDDKYIWVREEDLIDGEHIFLVKIQDVLYQSIVVYPEGFKHEEF